MKKLFYPFICLSLMSINALANTPNTNANISKHIIDSASEGREVIREPAKSATVLNKEKDKLFYAETILNWQLSMDSANPRGTEILGKTAENSLVKNLVEQVDKNTTKQEAKKELVVVKGYCFILDTIDVGKQPMSIRTDCQTNIGAITFFGKLVNLDEKSSLLVEPIYIEKNGVRFMVDSGITTNESKTSYNIATYVNDRKIAQIGYGSLSEGADEFKSSTHEYLQALEKSKTKQEVQYATTTDGAGNSYMSPISTTNTEAPDPLDYLVKSSINLVASTVKTTADVFKKDLPHLYQIVGDTKIWIDLKVNKKGEYVK